MLPIKYILRQIREYGVLYAVKIVFFRTVNVFLNFLILIFVISRPLKNTIIIASHDDFDNNGGEFYDWLIKHKYNRKYKIIWLLKHMDSMPASLPLNVECYSIYVPSFKRNFHICTAKYFLADDKITNKTRKRQISVYCTHGIGSLKCPRGRILIPDSVDYVLMPAKTYMPIVANALSMDYPNDKFVSLGYPVNDVMYSACDKSELLKLTKNTCKKVVMWLPTFRKLSTSLRCDSDKENPLGIPLVMSMEEYESLNSILESLDMLLIIKLHPNQSLEVLKIKDLSNIVVLTHSDMKEKNINLYKLLNSTDALISDYSSIVGAYLHLDRPIAYVFDDIREYKLDLISDDLSKVTAGTFIYNLCDMYHFLEDIAKGNDYYAEKRRNLRDYIYEYKDGNSCKRLAEFLQL